MAASPAPAAGSPTDAPPRKKGRKLILAVVCVVFTGAGAAVPMLVNVPALLAKPKEEKGKEKKEGKTAIVPFGEVIVNLSEDRLQRCGVAAPQADECVMSRTPGAHQEVDGGGEHDRHPSSIHDLEQVGAKEREVDDEEERGQQSGLHR